MTGKEDSEPLAELRLRYRAWLEQNVPPGWRECVAAGPEAMVAFQREWMRTLGEGGYAAPGWPREWGGMAASLAEQIVLYEETTRADAPRPTLFSIALNHTGATLLAHGSEAQKREHLPPILRGEAIWCQGFSEPNAGSDLASLRCRAVSDGDHYVVNGQKVWSSWAAHADWCLLLARTNPDAPKHKGISYFLLDLKTPGVEVRPLRQITGESEFCEIFLTDVRIPVGNRVGAENEGWTLSQTTLATERGPYFLDHVNRLGARMTRLVDLARKTNAETGRSPADDAHVRQLFARDLAEVEIITELYARILTSQLRSGRAGPESSILKLYYSELLQRLTGDAVRIAGPEAQLDPGGSRADGDDESWLLAHLGSWGLTIGGGTSEIQRNLIGERVLGLPREPKPK